MIYVYKNAAGETREIHASMKNPPPERVMFRDDGGWEPAADDADIPAWTRVYGDFIINDQKVSGKFGYHSRTLPLNIPGEETNARGQVLVKNKAHAAELCRKTGYQQFD